jgi:3-phytase
MGKLNPLPSLSNRGFGIEALIFALFAFLLVFSSLSSQFKDFFANLNNPVGVPTATPLRTITPSRAPTPVPTNQATSMPTATLGNPTPTNVVPPSATPTTPVGQNTPTTGPTQGSQTPTPLPTFTNPGPGNGKITASAETEPVLACGSSRCDAADDPAIWIHPTDPNKSLIIGTDKQGNGSGGLEVYDLTGKKLQIINSPSGNVDVRYNFPMDGAKIDIAAAYSKSKNSAAFYKINPATLRLEDITGSGSTKGGGTSLYRSSVSGKYYYLSNAGGVVTQYELAGSGGKINTTQVRSVSFGGGTTEGIAADDVLKNIYASEEGAHAVWKIPAEPDGGSTKTLVDSAKLTADTEGITIYYKSDGTGYLLVSNQGANAYNIYTREGNNTYIGTFTIETGTFDGTSSTDGIDVVNFPLGPNFPSGMFVAQDGANDNGGTNNNQDFKLVPWQQIAAKFNLSMDTTWDPRKIGQ